MTSFDLKNPKTKDNHRSPLIQAKLTIGEPNDPYEQEADRMAEQVMRMPESGDQVQRQCADCEEEELQMKPLAEGITPVVQRQGEEEEELQMKSQSGLLQRESEEEEELVQAKPAGGGLEASPSLESRLSSKKGQGQSMSQGTQQSMSRAFGADFSGVKVHTDGDSVQMNRELGARAFTHGSDVYFNQGEYNPASGEGKRLLGHELTHVVQQGHLGNQHLQRENDKKTSSNPKSSSDIHKDKFDLYKRNVGIDELSALQKNNYLDEDKVDEYFSKYEKFADEQLVFFYKTVTVAKENQLTGKMFATYARKIYDSKKDLRYVVPVEYALAQARLEGGVSRTERVEGNIFNIGAFDSGKSNYEKSINSLDIGFDIYYEEMSKKWLKEKKTEELLKPGNFTHGGGQVYATNPLYEAEISAEIGSMHMRNAGIKLTGHVGPGKKNNATDIAFVGEMLAKLGYLGEQDKTDIDKVTSAIAVFQKKEFVPSEEQWYKDRKNKVIAQEDKDNIAIKEQTLTDGFLSPNGSGIGLLYFKTHMGGKIPSLVEEDVTNTQIEFNYVKIDEQPGYSGGPDWFRDNPGHPQNTILRHPQNNNVPKIIPYQIGGDKGSKKIIRIAWTFDDGPDGFVTKMQESIGSGSPATWFIQYHLLKPDNENVFKDKLNDLKTIQDGGGEIGLHGIHKSRSHAYWFPSENAEDNAYETIEKAMGDLEEFYQVLTDPDVGIEIKFVRLPEGLLTELSNYLTDLDYQEEEAALVARNIINGEKVAGAAEKAKQDFETMKSTLDRLGLHLWGGSKSGDDISAQSWETETSGSSARTDNTTEKVHESRIGEEETIGKSRPGVFERTVDQVTESIPKSLVILAHDTSESDVREVKRDNKTMDEYAKEKGVKIEYYTMSGLFEQLTQIEP